MTHYTPRPHPAPSLDEAGNGSPPSYIAASYVKYLESAGARVVPVLWDADETQLRATFAGLSGLLFPGGGQDLGHYDSPFLVKARFLYNLVIAANARGDYFPLWVCLISNCLRYSWV